MLLLLSPAKSLDYESPLLPGVEEAATQPAFVPQAAELIRLLKPLGVGQVAELMDLSDKLAALNVARYGTWKRTATPENSRPAALAFDGDVYDGLQARALAMPDLEWAQEHLVILSGLYGALRPLDRLQPYRLEMGTRLANPHGADLYDFWGQRIAKYLRQRLAELHQAQPATEAVVVNLASQEYFRAVDRKALKTRVLDCSFEDWKNGGYKIISFHAKRARGLMARYAIERRVQTVEELQGFNTDGYVWVPEASQPDRWVFRRRLE